MKAKKKPIEKLDSSSLGVDLTPQLETVRVTEPPKRVGGGKVCRFAGCDRLIHTKSIFSQVENVDELIAKLKEAGVLPA